MGGIHPGACSKQGNPLLLGNASPLLFGLTRPPCMDFLLPQRMQSPLSGRGNPKLYPSLRDIPDSHWKISGHVIPNNSQSISLNPRSPICFRLFDRIRVDHSSHSMCLMNHRDFPRIHESHSALVYTEPNWTDNSLRWYPV